MRLIPCLPAARRGPPDHPRLNLEGLVALGPLNVGNEVLRREIAALVVGNGHGGKPQQLSQGRVVKARDGHIFGNAHARLAEGAHGPDGHVVIRADQRLGQPLANQQQLCRLVAAFFAVIAGQVAFGVKGDAVFLQAHP